MSNVADDERALVISIDDCLARRQRRGVGRLPVIDLVHHVGGAHQHIGHRIGKFPEIARTIGIVRDKKMAHGPVAVDRHRFIRHDLAHHGIDLVIGIHRQASDRHVREGVIADNCDQPVIRGGFTHIRINHFQIRRNEVGNIAAIEILEIVMTIPHKQNKTRRWRLPMVEGVSEEVVEGLGIEHAAAKLVIDILHIDERNPQTLALAQVDQGRQRIQEVRVADHNQVCLVARGGKARRRIRADRARGRSQ